MSNITERVIYYNGDFIPECEARIPFRDRGFRWGDGVYDQARTFNGKPFKLREHISRLYRSLKYVGIDPELSADEMLRISEEVLRRNLPHLAPGTDYWIIQRVNRGLDRVGDEGWEQTGATVLVECMPMPFKERAHLYRDGIRLETTSIRRTPPTSLSPRAKLTNYLNHFLADHEVQGRDPDSWALFLDQNGNIAEGTSNNVFLVRDGELLTPREKYVLGGISRKTVLELAHEENIPVKEIDLDLYDTATADEIFLTMTSLCLCPVVSFNGALVGNGKIPGPITKQLTDAFIKSVEFNFVAQFERHLQD